MKNLTLQFWILLVVSIISGVLIGLMDTSPNWDDTGITVGAIIIISFLTGLARPGSAWLWALHLPEHMRVSWFGDYSVLNDIA
jgi:hypothetical protein